VGPGIDNKNTPASGQGKYWQEEYEAVLWFPNPLPAGLININNINILIILIVGLILILIVGLILILILLAGLINTHINPTGWPY
jgi:hypothetical protein